MTDQRSQPLTVAHFVFAVERSEADAVAAELARLGFEVEVTKDAQDRNWMVRASHTEDLHELMSWAARMEEITAPFDVDYDGNEVAVPDTLR